MKASVLIITYNHEPFIEQAVQSALMQETPFDFEIVIGEDCSTDRTREIVLGLQKRFPEQIRLLLPNSNLGANANFVQTLKACQGEYIALLEGDDYWTCSHKLCSQVSLLEARPDLSLCTHEALSVWPDGRAEGFVASRRVPIKDIYTLDDVVQRHFLPTASMVMRASSLWPLPPHLNAIPAVDWLLHVMLARAGKIAFINELWSVYRIHEGGLTSLAPGPVAQKHLMHSAYLLDAYLDRQYTHILRPKVLDSVIEWLVLITIRESEPQSSGRYLKRVLADLTEELNLTERERQFVLGQTYLRLTFLSWAQGGLAQTRHYWLRALVHHQSDALGNYGFWSVGAAAFLGPKVHQQVSKAARILRSA